VVIILAVLLLLGGAAFFFVIQRNKDKDSPFRGVAAFFSDFQPSKKNKIRPFTVAVKNESSSPVEKFELPQ
jgi:hypothetical protein